MALLGYDRVLTRDELRALPLLLRHSTPLASGGFGIGLPRLGVDVSYIEPDSLKAGNYMKFRSDGDGDRRASKSKHANIATNFYNG
jgi:hypothetical protein